MHLEILRRDGNAIVEGAECEIEAAILMRTRWRSKITHFKPYEYVDEMTGGMFKSWRHLHRFAKVGENKTEVVDQIDFELPFGILGKIFESYAERRLDKVFQYRETATIDALRSQV